MLNESDKEIIVILKEVFRSKKHDIYYDPDDLLKHLIIKWFLFISLFSLILTLVASSFDKDISQLKSLTSIIITIFFGILFLYINSKSKNFSVIILLLTFLSLVISVNLF